jgi:hypothetical protein
MQEILTKIDNIQNFSEQDISAELKRLIPKDKTEISTELKAELLAFEFIENPYTENSEWGTYFRPMMVWRNDDGTTTESPSISLVDKVIMDYWYKRIFETNNSLMKARYSGLIWDFSKPILNVNPAYKIGIIYIESLIDTVDYDIENYEFESITKIKRAIQVSCTLNNTELINKAKEVTLKLELKIAQNDKTGFWGFSYDTLIQNPKVQLTEKEEQSIIESLELRFKELTSEDQLNPWNAEAAAERLANYFRRKGVNEKVKQIILALGKAYELQEKDGSAMQISSWLQHQHKIYINYGLHEEANSILKRLREIGPKINEELQLISSSFKLPSEKLEKFYEFILDGNKSQILHNIAKNFIPNKDELKERMFEMAKTTPLSYLISTNIQDSKGRVVATIGSLEEDLNGHLIHEMSEHLTFQALFMREIFHRIREKKIMSSNDIVSFINESPVFEESRLEILRKGIEAYFSDDLIVAIHLLIPQIEEAIRNLIEISGGIVLKKSREGNSFQLKTFDQLLRDDIIVKIFGEDIQLYLLVLFTDQRGWNLRNDVCHGMCDISSFSYQAIERIIHVLLILGILRKK